MITLVIDTGQNIVGIFSVEEVFLPRIEAAKWYRRRSWFKPQMRL
jgi:hypothetical protein